ncbi:MAG: helix-turn-helix transcriptional regulator [Oscillospiraceae bacterium]|jgi:DNA-binding Xre family transcriptional regulator|nr:helix-turn-helix transcriptional regulator [Oscillospiraceae bacterium]
MVASYKKLWKLLIDKNMNKRELAQKAHISSASIAKLGRGDNVQTDLLVKICDTLNCDVCDIMQMTREDETTLYES